MGALLELRDKSGSDDRNVVLNDVKLLAQAESTVGISHILTKDGGYRSRIDRLQQVGHVLTSQVLDLNVPMAVALGRLDLRD